MIDARSFVLGWLLFVPSLALALCLVVFIVGGLSTVIELCRRTGKAYKQPKS